MSGQSGLPAPPGRAGRLELLWRWLAFGVMPFALALTTAMAITAYAQARGSGGNTGGAAPPEPGDRVATG